MISKLSDEELFPGQPFALGLEMNSCSCFHHTEMRHLEHYTFVSLSYYSSKMTLQIMIMYLWLNFGLVFL